MEWHKGIHIAIPTCLGLRQGYCWMDQYTVNSIPRSIKKSWDATYSLFKWSIDETSSYGFLCIYLQLIVYGAGQVIPSSLTVLEPNLKYTLLVGLYPNVFYGRVVLVMDKNFCTDAAGNRFTRAANSSFFVHLGEFCCSFLKFFFGTIMCSIFLSKLFSALSSTRRFKPILYFYACN
jgi:hypothetical protein